MSVLPFPSTSPLSGLSKVLTAEKLCQSRAELKSATFKKRSIHLSDAPGEEHKVAFPVSIHIDGLDHIAGIVPNAVQPQRRPVHPRSKGKRFAQIAPDSAETRKRSVAYSYIPIAYLRKREVWVVRGMNGEYTAVLKNEDKWWIGWIEEFPDVNCRERTREELIESLKPTLREALELASAPLESRRRRSISSTSPKPFMTASIDQSGNLSGLCAAGLIRSNSFSSLRSIVSLSSPA